MGNIDLLEEKEKGGETSSIGAGGLSTMRIPPLTLQAGRCFQCATTAPGLGSVLEPDVWFITAPGTVVLVEIQRATRSVPAKALIGALGTEINPMVRVVPQTSRHYPLKVVGRSVASFVATSIRSIDEELE